MAIKVDDWGYSKGIYSTGKLGEISISGSYHVISKIVIGSDGLGVRNTDPDSEGYLSTEHYHTKARLEGISSRTATIYTAVFENSGSYNAGSQSLEIVTSEVILNTSASNPNSVLSQSYDALQDQSNNYVTASSIDRRKIK
tara:strand:- start:191 stop:613 length:423 start_codon:yes stop_codon:yes gene_type:complete